MKFFPDTSFLCSLYRLQIHSRKAVKFMTQIEGPLLISSLLALEFRQSVRLQTRLFEQDRTKGYSLAEGNRMLQQMQSDLNSGVLQMLAPDWADVHRIAEGLSAKYTREKGHRLADLLHVATAIHFGAAEFLTFDANQKSLAEAEGMQVPV